MKRGLYWLLALMPLTSLADDSLATELLARIQNRGDAKFRYEETRTLELATTPWHGQGYMLSGADGSLVKLQLKPKRVIMAIAHQRMYYWDPDLQQRHSAPLTTGGPGMQQIAVFRSILQGYAEDLQQSYDLIAENHGKVWTLWMKPKHGQGDQNAPSIEISGDDEDKQRQILLSQPDGESTEYRMTKATKDQQAEYSIPRLLQEAIGD